jgi:dihydrofolate synthase/folylpolyglutamate synthase
LKIDDYLQRFTLLHPKSIDLSLDRIWRLLRRLGDPQRSLPPTIHVAGTNGKGSVVAYLRAILESAGKRAHCYTSPHLVRFNERIRLPDGLISDGELEALFEECDRANGGEPITFFEITTVAAFLAFARHPADYLVMEVGLGGRLDTTNTSETTVLSVITPISYDHQRFLGDTLGQIAREKAGIMRAGVPVILAPQPPEAASALEAAADAIGALALRHGREWTFDAGPPLALTLQGRHLELGPLSLPGPHQNENASLAAAAALMLGDPAIDEPALRAGLAGAYWPARLQRLDQGPLRDLLPDNAELWLDGGHNESAGQALATWIDSGASDRRRFHVIVGMMETKDAIRFFRALGHSVRDILCVTIPDEAKAFPAEEIARQAKSAGLHPTSCANVADALRRIAAADPDPRVLICGSLYLAGSVLRENGPAVT